MDNTKQTQFAQTRRYTGKTILDLCCGNGRDTKYFNSTNNMCFGIDLIAPEGDSFIKTDINTYLRGKKDFVDVIYSRFGFHAIDEKTEDLIIEWAKTHAQEIAIEVRAEGDKPLIWTEEHHKRRYCNPKKLFDKLYGAGFNYISFKLGHGMAKFGIEDPYVLRIIARYE